MQGLRLLAGMEMCLGSNHGCGMPIGAVDSTSFESTKRFHLLLHPMLELGWKWAESRVESRCICEADL